MLRNIVPGETIVYQTKLHLIIFSKAVACFFISLLLIGVSAEFGRFQYSEIGIYLGLLIFGYSFLNYLATLMLYKTSEFGITNKWIIINIGWIRRETFELLLTKVESIRVEQDFRERLFNYGTITISSIGGAEKTFECISKPLQFRRHVHKQIKSSAAYEEVLSY